MKLYSLLQTGFFVVLLFSNYADGQAAPPASPTSHTAPSSSDASALKALMQNLAEPLTDLALLSSSPELFSNPKNKSKIETALKTFSEKAHSIEGLTRYPEKTGDRDPTAAFVAQNLKDTADRAAAEFKKGNTAYARDLARAIPQACIGCHTRLDTGAQFPLATSPKALEQISSIERIQFLTAIRQYDSALDSVKQVLKDTEALKRRPLDWERALNHGLAISIRVKKDPSLALAQVKAVLSQEDAPFYLKTQAAVWKSAIEAWKKESKRKIETPEGLIAEGKRLFIDSISRQKYPMDRSGYVSLLRTTEVLHRYLKDFGNHKQVGEALLMLGSSYEVLSELGLWSLHEVIYEVCIRKSPQSDISQACYSRLENAVIASYSGTAGTDVPSDVQKKLDELKALAVPKAGRN